MIASKQVVGLLIAVVVIVGGIIYLDIGKARPGISTVSVQDVALPVLNDPMSKKDAVSQADRIAEKLSKYDRAKEISAPAGFVNTQDKPIHIADYVGKKVILLDIMTYSCINCIRTYPYIVDWYKKYEDKGLIVIGIHTPEFEFEKVKENVESAMKKYGITFPVVLDNNYGTWTAYKNLYWPRKYLIDIDGFIRYDHIGEGGYAETEEVIKSLLKERADALGLTVDLSMPTTSGTAEHQTFDQSPETYLGAKRNEFLANGTPGAVGTKKFSLPKNLEKNKLYLDGAWSVELENVESQGSDSAIVYPFSAKKVFLVMSAAQPVDAEVLIDGMPVNPLDKGDDVRIAGGKALVSVSDSRLYSLYAGNESKAHTITIKASKSGLRVFAFTFGS